MERFFYQTTHDHANGIEYFIPGEDVEEIVFNNFLYPRNLRLKRDTNFINLETGGFCGGAKSGYIMKYTTKVAMGSKDGLVYYRSEEESDKMSSCVVLSSDTEEIRDWESVGVKNDSDSIDFVAFLNPRPLVFKESAYSIDAVSGFSCDDYHIVGDTIKFTTKVDIHGVPYFRTEENSKNGNTCVIPSIILGEV